MWRCVAAFFVFVCLSAIYMCARAQSELNAKLFYTELGERAVANGITVNIVSIIGAE